MLRHIIYMTVIVILLLAIAIVWRVPVDDCLEDGGIWDQNNAMCWCSKTAQGVYEKEPLKIQRRYRAMCQEFTAAD